MLPALILAVAANVGAFNLGAAAGSALGGAIVTASALRWTGLAGSVLSLTGLALSYLVLPRTGPRSAPAIPQWSHRERWDASTSCPVRRWRRIRDSRS